MRSTLKHLFMNSVSSVRTNLLIESVLRVKNDELIVEAKAYPLSKKYYCIGFGKAVFGMAHQVEKILQDSLVEGIISVPFDYCKLSKFTGNISLRDRSKFRVFEGATNNLPDDKAFETSRKITQLVKSLGEDDILLVLISGGGSALLPYPSPPITLAEKAETIRLLSSQGATIKELNGVRQNLSQTKGGKLGALAYPAQVISLILSDVIDDPIDLIASGPTVAPKCSNLEAMGILSKYSIITKVPKIVVDVLTKPPFKQVNEADLSHVQNIIIGNNSRALEATEFAARKYFDKTCILSNSVEGLVNEVSEFYLELVKLICAHFLGQITEEEFMTSMNELTAKFKINVKSSQAFERIACFKKGSGAETQSLCLLLGGETTVQVKGGGLGGRNQELALNFGLKLDELFSSNDWLKSFNVGFLSGGTDGIDGPTDAAGAITNQYQMKEAKKQDLDPLKYLENNDSNSFYSKLNEGYDLVKTGHTGTNVMDIHVIGIEYDEFKSLIVED